jgi:hypothetical protein
MRLYGQVSKQISPERSGLTLYIRHGMLRSGRDARHRLINNAKKETQT